MPLLVDVAEVEVLSVPEVPLVLVVDPELVVETVLVVVLFVEPVDPVVLTVVDEMAVMPTDDEDDPCVEPVVEWELTALVGPQPPPRTAKLRANNDAQRVVRKTGVMGAANHEACRPLDCASGRRIKRRI